MKKSMRDLHHDQRGAVMVMGLGMSCFLIGMLWYVIGIGDAMIVRDTAQEAADHAAFTSAVLHAKGMNFISAMNLILLAIVAVHMIFCLVVGIAGAVCAITCAAVVTGCAGCGFFASAMNWHSKYAKFMKPAGNTIHVIEMVAAYGYPYVGLWKSMTIGSDYGGRMKRSLATPAFSTSMLPAPKASISTPNSAEENREKAEKAAARCDTEVPADKEFTRSGGVTIKGDKAGLPVQSDTFKSVCLRISNNIVRSIQDLVRPFIPGFILNTPIIGDKILGVFEKVVKDLVGRGVTFTMCNDLTFSEITDPFQCNKDVKDAGGIEGLNKDIDNANAGAAEGDSKVGGLKTDSENPFPGFDKWWGEKGPMVSWSSSTNGDVWHQVWAIATENAFGSKYVDKSASKVSMASGANHIAAGPSVDMPMFVSQAEFFFDCAEAWTDPTCNGDQTSAYSIRWRARLRRVQAPALGTMLGDLASRGVKSLIGDLTNIIIDKVAGDKIDGAGTYGPLVRGRIAEQVGQITKPFTDTLTKGIQDIAGNLNPQTEGIYH